MMVSFLEVADDTSAICQVKGCRGVTAGSDLSRRRPSFVDRPL